MFSAIGVLYPFLSIPKVMNLAKTQAPLLLVWLKYSYSDWFVCQQSEFAFFGAQTSVGALFCFIKEMIFDIHMLTQISIVAAQK